MADDKKTEVDPHREFYDLVNQCSRSTISVIDAMSARGAFKGEELSTVGQLRDKTLQLIQMVESYHSELG